MQSDNSNNPHYLLHKAHNYILKNNHIGALKCCLKALNEKFDDPIFLTNLGSLFICLKEYEKAIQCFQKSENLSPNNFNTLINTATVLFNTGELHKSLVYALKAYKYHQSQSNKIEICRLLGRLIYPKLCMFKEAQPYLKIATESDNYQDYFYLAILYDQLSDRKNAEKYYRRVLDIHNDCETYFNFYQMKKYDPEANKQDFERVRLNTQNTSGKDLMWSYFTLGKMYEDIQDYDNAFRLYTCGNNVKREMTTNKRDKIRIIVNAYTNIFTSRLFQHLQNQNIGSTSKLPIFISGMPRSGTTLVDRILSSHSKASSVGENTFLTEVIKSISPKCINSELVKYPFTIQHMTSYECDVYTAMYLEKIHTRLNTHISIEKHKTIERIINKTTSNYFNLGIIRILFPGATFVACKRHPLDICIALYVINFVSYDDEITNCCSFENIIEAYRQYNKIMKWWYRTIGNIHDVYYEELVYHPEKVSKALVEACGLEWEDECLKFYSHSDSLVLTASRWQVNQPIHTSSVFRYKHYEKWIEMCKQQLKDEIVEYETELKHRVPELFI